MAIKGYGNMVKIADDGTLYVDRLSQVQFSTDVQTRDVDGYPFDNPDGLLQIVDSFITRETFDVQVTTGSFDKYTLSRVFDQKISQQDFQLPHAEKLKIGDAATPEIDVATLIADQEVGVFFTSDTNPIQYKQVTAAPAAADEFQVTAGKVVFDASQADKEVVVNYFKEYTSIESIGVENMPIGDLGFTGRLIGPRFDIGPLFFIPKMSRNSGFQFGGENSQITYRATVKDPYAKPIIFAFDVPLVA